MNIYEQALAAHTRWSGKLAVVPTVPLETAEDMSLAYTPGVAEPCMRIAENGEAAYQYTMKGNFVAIITDGTAVLGLGDIGPLAAIPVMEGKAALFKHFGGIDAVPLCLDTKDTEEIIRTVKYIAPSFGGINLEDISAPRCFEIERRLQEELDIPVFHDDQHGTAIICTAAVINAMKVVGKALGDIKVIVNGAGAAGTAIVNMLNAIGVTEIVVCDRNGILCRQDLDPLNPAMRQLALNTNPKGLTGGLAEAIQGADLFVGVSAPHVLTQELVQTMSSDAVIFAMANPEPEILPDLALAAGARVVGTGRSDFQNQINNVMVFPGLFKGALRVRAKKITSKMKVAAAYAIANTVPTHVLDETHIVPGIFDSTVVEAVASAVADAWLSEQI